MLDQLLPPRFDNAYRGYKLALWLLGLLLLMKAGIGLGCIFNGHEAASRGDGVPIDGFTPGGVQTVLALFAIWGLSQVILALLGTTVLVRYRSMVPFMFTLLLLEHVGRKLILYFLPVPKTGTPPGFFVNLGLFAVEIVGLALSLFPRDRPRAQG
jgi:hypothetical protein